MVAFDIDLGDLVDETNLTAKLSGGDKTLTLDDLLLTSSGSTVEGKTTVDLTGDVVLLSGSLSVDKLNLDALT